MSPNGNGAKILRNFFSQFNDPNVVYEPLEIDIVKGDFFIRADKQDYILI